MSTKRPREGERGGGGEGGGGGGGGERLGRMDVLIELLGQARA